LEPCGCQQRPLGGVARLATALARAGADGAPSLLLAAGDLAAGTEVAKGDESSAVTQETWRAETLIDIWRELGMDAACPGPLDLEARAATTALIARGGFPWVVENMADSALPLTRAVLLDAGGIRVGVFGLVAPSPGLSPSVSAMLTDPPLAELARTTASELRTKGARVVVALVHADRRTARDLGGNGIDIVVLGGLDAEQPLAPVVHRGTAIVHAGRQGQRLLSLELGLGHSGDQSELHDESAWTRNVARSEVERDVADLSSKLAAWEKDGTVATADLEGQRSRLAAMKSTLAAPAVAHYEGRWFEASVLELSPEVVEQPAIGQRLNAYDVRVNDHNRVALQGLLPPPAPAGIASYVGSEACKGCHDAAYAWWKRTPHGNAYATLERVHKEFNLSCVGCHVTGYNRPGGSTVTHVADLKNVGCESCHGPGSLHAVAGDQRAHSTLNVPESSCRGCHTPEHSDRFVYEGFRAALLVPGHGRPAAP
jgi:hypothetical protein